MNDADAVRGWRKRGRDDAFARRPSAVAVARGRHGEKAARAYLAGWRLGEQARAEHDAGQRVTG